MAKKSTGPNGKPDSKTPVDPDKTPVYVRALRVENVRCFGPEKQELNFCGADGRPSQWTVLLGDNGTGKTTLLQCLAMFDHFGGEPPYTTEHSYPRFVGIPPQWQWPLCSVERQDGYRLDVQSEYARTLDSTGQRREASLYTVEVLPARKGYFQVGKGRQLAGCTALPRFYGYGAARRIEEVSGTGDTDSDALASLFDDHAELRDAEDWLINLDYSASKDSSVQKRQRDRYEQVRQLLIEILPDVTGIRIVVPADTHPEPRVEFRTPDGWIPLRWIGYGYQTLIAWMVDFASRMVERYPRHKDPLKQPAVVLVDEIDLHMHPQWQRKLMGYLSERFPNTQFIVTAHSPIFVQAATGANIAVLRRDEKKKCVIIDNSPEAIRGWRIDQLLTSDLFGLPTARPPELEKLLLDRKKLLSKARLTKRDREKLAALEEKIGKLPGGETLEDAKRMELMDRTLDALEKQLEKKS
jgi:energy-coupling factor transporter ATP-binding protein EcfA2